MDTFRRSKVGSIVTGFSIKIALTSSIFFMLWGASVLKLPYR